MNERRSAAAPGVPGPPFLTVVILFLGALTGAAAFAGLLAAVSVPAEWVFAAGATAFGAVLVGLVAATRWPARVALSWRTSPPFGLRRLLGFTIATAISAAGASLAWDAVSGGDPRWSAFFDETLTASEILAVYAGAVLAAPLAEELAFRGLLQTALVPRIGRWPAIVATGAVFAAWHVRSGDVVGAFVWGLPVGWLAWRCGSVVWGVAVHVVNNAIAVLLEVTAVVMGGAAEWAPATESADPGGLVLGCVLLAAGGVWLLGIGRRLDRTLPAPEVGSVPWGARWGRARRLAFTGGVAVFVLAMGLVGFAAERVALGEGEPYRVGGRGMEPTVLSGDLLIVEPLERPPYRGEVVLVHPFGGADDTFVQRVVGVGGDTVAMEQGRLRVNGREVDERYARPPDARADSASSRLDWMADATPTGARTPAHTPAHTPATWGPIVVPPGHLFLLGDNRANAYDGRFTGFARCEWIAGTPVSIYFSVGAGGLRWRRIGAFDPAAARPAWGGLWQPAPCPATS
ncbi:MAG: signal peptidase I [Gemmatimonadota bacterium]